MQLAGNSQPPAVPGQFSLTGYFDRTASCPPGQAPSETGCHQGHKTLLWLTKSVLPKAQHPGFERQVAVCLPRLPERLTRKLTFRPEPLHHRVVPRACLPLLAGGFTLHQLPRVVLRHQLRRLGTLLSLLLRH